MTERGGEAAGAGPVPRVRTILRLEGLAAFLAAVTLYGLLGAPWWLFVVLFLVPDLAILAFRLGPRLGARVYNLAHTYLGPALVGGAGLLAAPAMLPVAAVWAAHIGFDRALGFGLKAGDGFAQTHLGEIGRRR